MQEHRKTFGNPLKWLKPRKKCRNSPANAAIPESPTLLLEIWRSSRFTRPDIHLWNRNSAQQITFRTDMVILLTRANCCQQNAWGFSTSEMLDIWVPNTNAPSNVQLLQGSETWIQYQKDRHMPLMSTKTQCLQSGTDSNFTAFNQPRNSLKTRREGDMKCLKGRSFHWINRYAQRSTFQMDETTLDKWTSLQIEVLEADQVVEVAHSSCSDQIIATQT